MNLLVPLAVLLVFQLAGEVFVRLFGLPVPGPVVGFVLLFAGLCLRGGVPGELAAVANGLLAHLSLLFVPAGVGVVLHLSRIQAEWPAIVVSLLVSTWLALAVGALVMRLVSRALGDPDHANGTADGGGTA